MDAERPFRLVTGVLREALRSSGLRRIALAGEGPETRLLLDWMVRARIPWVRPSPSLLAASAELRATARRHGRETTPHAPMAEEDAEFGSPRPGDRPGREGGTLESWRLSGVAARSLAQVGPALLVGAESKTLLMLGIHPTEAGVLPLGDLYASEIHQLADGCTQPPFLTDRGTGEITAVDRALRAYLEDGIPVEAAFASLPEAHRTQVLRALDRARARMRVSLLIPKLGRATLGIDLDL